VNLREIFVENFAGDLEYHPRRAVVYLILAVAAFCFWILSPSEVQFTTTPFVFALGSLALLIKGIFLMRKSSEGLGLSDKELARLSDPSNRKSLPSIVGQASQVVQDFGTGSFSSSLASSQYWQGYRQIMERPSAVPCISHGHNSFPTRLGPAARCFFQQKVVNSG